MLNGPEQRILLKIRTLKLTVRAEMGALIEFVIEIKGMKLRVGGRFGSPIGTGAVRSRLRCCVLSPESVR